MPGEHIISSYQSPNIVIVPTRSCGPPAKKPRLEEAEAAANCWRAPPPVPAPAPAPVPNPLQVPAVPLAVPNFLTNHLYYMPCYAAHSNASSCAPNCNVCNTTYWAAQHPLQDSYPWVTPIEPAVRMPDYNNVTTVQQPAINPYSTSSTHDSRATYCHCTSCNMQRHNLNNNNNYYITKDLHGVGSQRFVPPKLETKPVKQEPSYSMRNNIPLRENIIKFKLSQNETEKQNEIMVAREKKKIPMATITQEDEERKRKEKVNHGGVILGHAKTIKLKTKQEGKPSQTKKLKESEADFCFVSGSSNNNKHSLKEKMFTQVSRKKIGAINTKMNKRIDLDKKNSEKLSKTANENEKQSNDTDKAKIKQLKRQLTLIEKEIDKRKQDLLEKEKMIENEIQAFYKNRDNDNTDTNKSCSKSPTIKVREIRNSDRVKSPILGHNLKSVVNVPESTKNKKHLTDIFFNSNLSVVRPSNQKNKNFSPHKTQIEVSNDYQSDKVDSNISVFTNKINKVKTIQIIIKATDESNDDNSESDRSTSTQHDLSFLDEIDVDEIAACLKVCKNVREESENSLPLVSMKNDNIYMALKAMESFTSNPNNSVIDNNSNPKCQNLTKERKIEDDLTLTCKSDDTLPSLENKSNYLCLNVKEKYLCKPVNFVYEEEESVELKYKQYSPEIKITNSEIVDLITNCLKVYNSVPENNKNYSALDSMKNDNIDMALKALESVISNPNNTELNECNESNSRKTSEKTPEKNPESCAEQKYETEGLLKSPLQTIQISGDANETACVNKLLNTENVVDVNAEKVDKIIEDDNDKQQNPKVECAIVDLSASSLNLNKVIPIVKNNSQEPSTCIKDKKRADKTDEMIEYNDKQQNPKVESAIVDLSASVFNSNKASFTVENNSQETSIFIKGKKHADKSNEITEDDNDKQQNPKVESAIVDLNASALNSNKISPIVKKKTQETSNSIKNQNADKTDENIGDENNKQQNSIKCAVVDSTALALNSNHVIPIVRNDAQESVISTKNHINELIESKVLEALGIPTTLEPIKSSETKLQVNKLIVKIMRTLSCHLTVTGIIHRGAFGSIYHLRDEKGNQIAAKVLHPSKKSIWFGSKNTSMWTELQNGVPRSKLCCVYLMTGLPFDNTWCYLMSYHPTNLEKVLKETNKCFHIDTLLVIARQLMSAVLLLRNHNIIHSDIKPHHILYDKQKRVARLCGFDRAHYSTANILTSSMGTLPYRPPEVILGYYSAFGVDVWATAAVLHELATNTRVFDAPTNNEVLYRQMSLLGCAQYSMLLNSKFAASHYTQNYEFVRRYDAHSKAWNTIIRRFPMFPNEAQVARGMCAAYARDWGAAASGAARARDYANLRQLGGLLARMMAVNPRLRTPIEFAYSSPIIYTLPSGRWCK